MNKKTQKTTKKQTIKKKQKPAKNSKNQQSKKSLLLPQIVDFYLDNGCCYSKTARHFKWDRGAVTNYIQSPEGRELIRKRMQAYDDLVFEQKRLVLNKFAEFLNKGKAPKDGIKLLYAGMQMTGLTNEVQVAKIQAGIGQKDTESNDFQVTTEELEDFRKSLKYN